MSWLQAWFAGECDGQWEHLYGIRIATLDNPGWSVEIDFGETPLEGLSRPVFLEERTSTDWISFELRDARFIAHGGPRNLDELIGVFREFWEKQISHEAEDPHGPPPYVVESYLVGVVNDPARRQVSFTFRTPQGDREFILHGYEVDRLSMTEFSEQNIVHDVRVFADRREPERIHELLADLLFERNSASGIAEPTLRARLEEAATSVFEGRKLLIEIEPVYGASVILLAGAIEWVLPRRNLRSASPG